MKKFRRNLMSDGACCHSVQNHLPSGLVYNKVKNKLLRAVTRLIGFMCEICYISSED